MDFEEVKITVNGKEIEVNQFVTSVMGNAIMGMVSSLKLDDEPHVVEIKITKK